MYIYLWLFLASYYNSRWFRGGSVGSVRFLKSGVCSFSTSDRAGGERGVCEGCAQHPGEEIQSLRERTRWMADTVGVHITLRQKNAHGATFIFPVYYPTLASKSYKNLFSLQWIAGYHRRRRRRRRRHVTILIEARHNSDGSGATTRFYRRDSSRRVAIKRSANISRHLVSSRASQIRKRRRSRLFDADLVAARTKGMNSISLFHDQLFYATILAGFTENYWSFKFTLHSAKMHVLLERIFL